MFGFAEKPLNLPSSKHALPGREHALIVTNQHFVTGRPIKEPFPDNCKQAVFGLGCFWGAERFFWQHDGIYTCLLYTSPSPRDATLSRMPSSA